MFKKIIKKVMLWLLIIVFSFILLFILVGYMISAPGYKGNKSGHFNGSTFENFNNVKAKEFKDLLKWAVNRDRGSWEKIERLDEYPVIANPVSRDEFRITFVNHSTFLIQIGDLNILTDPIWSDRTSPVQFAGPQRVAPPGLEFEDLPEIDIVIISHNHYDHLDVNTVKMLEEKFSPQFYAPLGVSQFLKDLGVTKAQDLDWWEEVNYAEKTALICVPAQHFSGRGAFDRDKTLWAGFVIKVDRGSIYFAGDTGYGKFFKEIGEKFGPFDVSFLPIGAYLPAWFMSPIHISPKEAVQVHLDVRSRQTIPMHFGTFPLADDGMNEPLVDLEKAIESHSLSKDEFIILKNGGQCSIDLSQNVVTND